MMAAYNYNKRINFSRTFKQLTLNAEGIGADYSVNDKDKKKKEDSWERLVKQSVQQAISIYEASNGEINLFLDDKSVDIDGLTGEAKQNGSLDKYGHPGKRLSQSKYLGVNQVKFRLEEVKMFQFFLQVCRRASETDVECYDGEIKFIPRLQGYQHDTFELRYVVVTRGRRVPVNQIAQRREELLLLLKEINNELKDRSYNFELLKWTLEVTYRMIDGVVYAHPHLNLIYATEHLNEHQEQLWIAALHEATWDDQNPNIGTGNYIRDCGAIEEPAACLRYITKPYHPVDEDKKAILGQHDNNDSFVGARRFGEYYGYQQAHEDEIDVGKELLLHELPPEELMIAYKALYATAGSKPKTAGRGGAFKEFCKFFEENGLNIKARKNKAGYTEYVPVFKELKIDPETKKKNKKKKKKKVKKISSGSPVNYMINSGSLIPDADKGVMNVNMKITGFDRNANRDFIRERVEQLRENARINNPDAILPEIHDDALTNEERAERRLREQEKAKRDAVVKEREMLGRVHIFSLIAHVLYKTNKSKFYIMFSISSITFHPSFSCLASMKHHAHMVQYDFVDVAVRFIQIHANAPPPR